LRSVEPIRWTAEGVVMLDQRRLPGERQRRVRAA